MEELMQNSPLGQYAPIAATLISIGIIAVDLLIHLLVAIGIAPQPDSFIDELTFGAFGVVLGQLGAHTEAVQTAANKVNGVDTKLAVINDRLTALESK